MAAIFKKIFTKQDPQTEKRIQRKTRKWYIRYKDADGVYRDVPGFIDKEATRHLAAQLERRAAREAVGLEPRSGVHPERKLSDHVEDFQRYLETKGNTEKHVRLKIARIQAVLEGCGFSCVRDITASRVTNWLAEKMGNGISLQTGNHYLTSIKGFVRWMVLEKRMPEDPLGHLRGSNPGQDRTRIRRTLTGEEMKKLLMAARDEQPFRGISGMDRAVLYALAAYSGLRASELASLRPENFYLNSNPPVVTVKASYSKRRRNDVVPLKEDVADFLGRWIETKPVDAFLWPGTWKVRASVMLKRDLAAAGLPYSDQMGRVFDFHAFRHQFISSLADSGAHPRIAQVLARHSTVSLTLDRYTHLASCDEAQAVERLPDLPMCPAISAAVTGPEPKGDDDSELAQQLARTPDISGQLMSVDVKSHCQSADAQEESQVHATAAETVAEQGDETGIPGRTRTCGLRFRKPSLYPPELRGRKAMRGAGELAPVGDVGRS